MQAFSAPFFSSPFGPYVDVAGLRFDLGTPQGMRDAREALAVAGVEAARIHTSDGAPTRRYLRASRAVVEINTASNGGER